MQQLPTSGLDISVVPPLQDLSVRSSKSLLIHFLALGLPISAAFHGCQRTRRVKRRRILMQQACHGPGDELPLVHKIFVIVLQENNPVFSRKWMLILEFCHAWQWLPRSQKVIVWQLPHRLSQRGAESLPCFEMKYTRMRESAILHYTYSSLRVLIRDRRHASAMADRQAVRRLVG